jgi:hypothetical protein
MTDDSCAYGDQVLKVLIQGLRTSEYLFLIHIGRHSITKMEF